MRHRMGGMLLITSNAKGGYENVAVLKVGTEELRWLTDTQWAAVGWHLRQMAGVWCIC
jgi:hypothetical protein